MWLTPSSMTRRNTASAVPRSRGGPHTPGPGSCMAPKPIRATCRPARKAVPPGGISVLLWDIVSTSYAGRIAYAFGNCAERSTEAEDPPFHRRVSRAHRSVVTTDGEQVAIGTAFVRNAALSSEVRVTCHVAARHPLIDL